MSRSNSYGSRKRIQIPMGASTSNPSTVVISKQGYSTSNGSMNGGNATTAAIRNGYGTSTLTVLPASIPRFEELAEDQLHANARFCRETQYKAVDYT